jgi:hypothetical protein
MAKHEYDENNKDQGTMVRSVFTKFILHYQRSFNQRLGYEQPTERTYYHFDPLHSVGPKTYTAILTTHSKHLCWGQSCWLDHQWQFDSDNSWRKARFHYAESTD